VERLEREHEEKPGLLGQAEMLAEERSALAGYSYSG